MQFSWIPSRLSESESWDGRGTSLVVQWLRLHAPNAGRRGSSPDQGTGCNMLKLKIPKPQQRSKIPHASVKTQHRQIAQTVKNRPAKKKESACNAGDPGSIPGLGRPPGEGNGYPLRYSCLENFMDGGAWQATVYGVTKSQMSDFTPSLWLLHMIFLSGKGNFQLIHELLLSSPDHIDNLLLLISQCLSFI